MMAGFLTISWFSKTLQIFNSFLNYKNPFWCCCAILEFLLLLFCILAATICFMQKMGTTTSLPAMQCNKILLKIMIIFHNIFLLFVLLPWIMVRNESSKWRWKKYFWALSLQNNSIIFIWKNALFPEILFQY